MKVNSKCVVCGETMLDLLGYDINFNKSTKKDHNVCFICVKETHNILNRIKSISPHCLPLYINHKNIFVREAALKRLRDIS